MSGGGPQERELQQQRDSEHDDETDNEHHEPGGHLARPERLHRGGDAPLVAVFLVTVEGLLVVVAVRVWLDIAVGVVVAHTRRVTRRR